MGSSVICISKGERHQRKTISIAPQLTFSCMVKRSKVRSVSIRNSKSDNGAKAVLGVVMVGVTAVIFGTVIVGLLWGD